MRVKKILLVLLLITSYASFSQNLVWYFGQANSASKTPTSYGLDFTSGSPVQRNTESAIAYYESVSVVSNSTGDVLFYSDGIEIMDGSHNLMSGAPVALTGTQQGVTASSVQGAFTLQKPGSSNEYYLFTSGAEDGTGTGFRANRIDMSLPGNGTVGTPLGEVVSFDSLLAANTGEMMTAYGNCGSDSVWVITHSENSYDFVRVLITSNGIQYVQTQNVPSPNQVGANPDFSTANVLRGSMDINSDGTKLILTGAAPIGSHIFDFDKSTGLLSAHAWVTDPTGATYFGYGSEFSPDGSKVYFAQNVAQGIWQYDVASQVSTQITTSGVHGEIITGPDDVLYIGKPNQSLTRSIGTIVDANNPVGSINYTYDAITFPEIGPGYNNVVSYAMPQGFFCPIDPDCEIDSVAEVCDTDPAFQFTANKPGTWGGGAYINASGIFDPSLAGVGTNWITFDGGCPDPDSVQMVVVSCCPNIDPNLGANITICDDQTTTLDAGAGLSSYQWKENGVIMVGQIGSTITADSGTYIVNITDANGCPGTDTIEIGNHQLPTVDLGPDTFYCATDSFQLDAGVFAVYAWTPNSETSQQVWAATVGTYSVTVTDANGCQNTDAVIISESALPAPSITGNTIVCEDSTTLITGVAGSGGTLSWSGITPSTNPLAVTAAGTYTIIETDANGCVDSADYSLTLENLPNVDLGGPYNFCFSQGNQTLNAATGGANETYLWSDNSSQSTLNVTDSSIVSVIVTSENGCIAYDTAVIDTFSLPTVDLGNDTAFCTLDSVQLDAGAGFANYAWTPNVGNGQTVFAKTVASYSVIVTDGNGCNGTDTVEITTNALPAPSITGNTIVCQDSTTLITGVAGSGGTLAWSGITPSTNPLAVTAAGTYTIIETGTNGCVDSADYTLTLENLPVVNLGGPYTFCFSQGNQTLDAATGGANETYVWSDNSNGSTLNVTDSSIVSVIVTSENGCIGYDTTVIDTFSLPIVDLGDDTFFCALDSVELDAGAGYTSYAWKPNNEIGQTISANTADTYSVIVTDGNGCNGTDTVEITERTLPTPTITGNAIVCEDSTTLITGVAGSGGTLAWSGINSFTNPLAVTAAGTYTIIETGTNGCVDSADYTLTLENLPVVNLGGPYTFCFSQGNQTLDAATGGANETYLWSDNSNGSTLNVTDSSIVSVIVTSENGCIGYDTAVIDTFSLPIVDLGNDTFFCALDSVELDAGAGYADYAWTPNVGTGRTVFAKTVANYSVIVTDGNGCNGTDTVEITENALPIVNIGSDTAVCEADSLIIDATHADALSYAWTPNSETSATIKVGSSDGTYEVTITDVDGCVFTTNKTISQDGLPNIDLGVNDTICDDLTKILDAGAGAGYNYTWYLDGSILGNTAQTQAADSGNYVVSVTTALGCETRDTILVLNHQLPLVDLSGSYEFCELDSVQLDAGNPTATFVWTPNSETVQTIWAKSNETYNVTVTDTNGCVNSGSSQVSENSNPIVDLGANDSACVGLAIPLDATVPNGVTYVWSNGNNQATYSLVGPDTLTVIVTDNKGCIGYDTLEIAALDSLELTFDKSNQVCQGAEEDHPLDAGSFQGGIYTWTLPDATTDGGKVIIPLLDGWYKIEITDQFNCKGSDSIFNVVIPLPNINIGDDTSFCSLGQGTYTVKMIFDENVNGIISWNDGEDNNNINDSLFTATYAPSLIIGQFIDDATQCVHRDSVQLTEFCEPTKIILPNIFTPGGTNNTTFHPIGLDDNNYVEIVNNIVSSEFEVYNRWGLKVYQSENLLPRWDGMYENRPVPSGTYYWIYKYTDSSLIEYKMNGFVQVIQMR